MTYQQILIDFMQAKHDAINEYFSIDYFNDADKNFLFNLSDEHAKNIVDSLLENLKKLYNFVDIAFNNLTCPFCIYYADIIDSTPEYCKNCEYKKNHSNLDCNTKNSTYKQIWEEHYNSNSSFSLYKIFTLDFHKSLEYEIYKKIKEIENKESYIKFKFEIGEKVKIIDKLQNYVVIQERIYAEKLLKYRGEIFKIEERCFMYDDGGILYGLDGVDILVRENDLIKEEQEDHIKYNYKIIVENERSTFLINYDILEDLSVSSNSKKWFVQKYGNKSISIEEFEKENFKVNERYNYYKVEILQEIEKKFSLKIFSEEEKNKYFSINKLEDPSEMSLYILKTIEDVFIYINKKGFVNLETGISSYDYQEEDETRKEYFKRILKNSSVSIYNFNSYSLEGLKNCCTWLSDIIKVNKIGR